MHQTLGITIAPGSLADRILREIESEAKTHVERVFGQVYERIPEPVKREVEGRYLQRRMAEERERITAAAMRVAPKVGPALLVGGALLAMMLLGRK